MQYCQVWVKSIDGRRFLSRVVEISEHHTVLRGAHMLPSGMVCDLQVIIPAPDEKQPSSVADLQAEVDEVVFSSGDICLNFKVKSLSREARHLISSRK